MVDFLKILITDNQLRMFFYQNSLLTWLSKNEKLSHFDFETIYCKETKVYKGILFCFYENKLEILFRPHYYFNDNLHNANDFKTLDCINVFREFINVFTIKNPEALKIINIEYGINIKSPIDVKTLVTYLSYHSKNEFRNDDLLAFSKKSYRTNKNGTANTHKIIKAYAKGVQFPDYCEFNTLRFEVKSKKSAFINSLRIFTFDDLLQPELYSEMANSILNEWDECLILGTNNESDKLTTRENNFLSKYQNPFYWFEIKQKHRNEFNKVKKRYFKLLNKSGTNIHIEIKNIIQQKLEQTGAFLPTIQNRQKGAILHVYIMKECTSLQVSKMNNSVYKKQPKKTEKIDWSYTAQKEAISKHNKLAVINYNNRNYPERTTRI